MRLIEEATTWQEWAQVAASLVICALIIGGVVGGLHHLAMVWGVVK